MPTPLRPEWMEWVEVTVEGWKLKEGAPEEVKQAFKEFEESIKIVKDEEEE